MVSDTLCFKNVIFKGFDVFISPNSGQTLGSLRSFFPPSSFEEDLLAGDLAKYRMGSSTLPYLALSSPAVAQSSCAPVSLMFACVRRTRMCVFVFCYIFARHSSGRLLLLLVLSSTTFLLCFWTSSSTGVLLLGYDFCSRFGTAATLLPCVATR